MTYPKLSFQVRDGALLDFLDDGAARPIRQQLPADHLQAEDTRGVRAAFHHTLPQHHVAHHATAVRRHLPALRELPCSTGDIVTSYKPLCLCDSQRNVIFT